jgi:hypothetical protein
MGLHIQSLENIPKDADRDYFIYLLDYGWHEPLGEALMNNYEKMADLAAQNRAVVIRGTKRVHFEDQVLSWHHINGENAQNLLPAILITNRHPAKFKESYGSNPEPVEENLKLILIPLSKFCKTTSEVVSLIQKLFSDISNKRDLAEFSVAREMKKGIRGAFADALILQPNWNGIGLDIKTLYQYLRGSNDSSNIRI